MDLLVKDKDRTIFENLKNIATVLVETFGRNCEVAIHDFEDLPTSLIHIEGNVTRRQPGAPITDLVVRAIKRDGNKVRDMCNYRTTTREGRSLKSSTAFVRNEKGEIVGAFCVNFDVTDFLNSVSLLADFAETLNNRGVEEKHETFASSVNETIQSLLDQGALKIGKQPGTMSKEEKVQLVGILEYHGGFLLKGATEYVAKALGVSKFTIYNYLKEIRVNSESQPT